MSVEPLSAALEREHQDVDAGIEAFLHKLDAGSVAGDVLGATLTALRRHIYLEEELLFPPLRQGALMMSIFGMIRGHGEIWRTMDELDDLVATGADHDRLREACQKLLTLLAAHNKVEEPVIYPAADTGLDPQQSAELTEFIQAGQLPGGWVCEKAAGFGAVG